MPRRRWSLASPDTGALEALCRDAALTSPVAACLLGRGVVDPETARRFLAPRLSDLTPPERLIDSGVAAQRLARAVTDGERITVFGDYDVDGITATVLLLEFLRALGATVDYELPLRDAGYGLSIEAVQRAVAAGANLLITVDCGTSAIDAVTAARAAGLDVVVTDHHLPGGPLPDAAAVFNPQREAGGPGHELAGVGVALHLAIALRARLREQGFFGTRPEPNLKALLDLVALGTIADVASLTGENRILVAVGLGELSRTRRPGLAELIAVSGAREPRAISSRDVAFGLAPRLNAAGRMGDPSRGVELLLTDDPARARALAGELDAENGRRRAEQDRVLDEAWAMLGEVAEERMALVVAGEGWPRGVVGLVAGRLADRLRRPAVALTREGERCVGSARSVAPLDLHDALSDCDELLLEWGGHAEAAGLSLQASNLQAFGQALDRAVAARVTAEDLQETLHLDGALQADQIDDALVRDLNGLAPHGQGNPPPLFMLDRVKVRESWTMGRDKATLGLELEMADGRRLRGVGFGLGKQRPEPGVELELAARPVHNSFRGTTSLELMVEDLREAQP